ncbi:hypothetical protein HYX11_02230 [Candidatus Woesearchaeota archaeon]|nr:hypothetical protein [Candidatus Woesearchaeota archaeon]
MNIVLFKKSKEAEELCKELGLVNNYFLEDVLLAEGRDKKKLLQEINLGKNQGKLVIYKVNDEETLRFVLEKTNVDVVIGAEGTHEKDSLHYVRAGLDDVLCKIAADRGKTIGFSFSSVLNSSVRGKLLARMMLNVRLCKKYKIKTMLSNFSNSVEEMRSSKDLDAWGRVLGLQ